MYLLATLRAECGPSNSLAQLGIAIEALPEGGITYGEGAERRCGRLCVKSVYVSGCGRERMCVYMCHVESKCVV